MIHNFHAIGLFIFTLWKTYIIVQVYLTISHLLTNDIRGGLERLVDIDRILGAAFNKENILRLRQGQPLLIADLSPNLLKPPPKKLTRSLGQICYRPRQ